MCQLSKCQKSNRRRRLAPALAVLAALPGWLSGCREPVTVQSTLSIALPQEASLEFVEVLAEQNGETIEPTSSSALTMTFELTAGVPVTIDATLFDLAIPGLFGYAGSITFTPEPGSQTVDLSVESMPTATGSPHAFFDDARELTAPLPVSIRDTATGYTIPDAFILGSPFTLPTGRQIEFSVVNPVTGTPVFTLLTVGASLDTLDIDAGTGPAAFTGVTFTNGAGIDLRQLNTVGDLALQCAFALPGSCSTITPGSCPDIEPSSWGPCDASLNLKATLPPTDALLEGCYPLAVRYTHIQDSCGLVPVEYDFTPPQVTVVSTPSFIPTEGQQVVSLEITSREALDPESIIVTLLGQSANLCPAPTSTPSGQSIVCPNVSWSLTDGPTWRTLVTKGTDIAKNPFSVQTHIHDLRDYPPQAGADLTVTSVRLHPSVPSPNDWFFVSAEIQNLGDVQACSVYVENVVVQDSSESFQFWPTVQDIEWPLEPGASGTAWLQLSPTETMDAYPNGAYQLSFELAWQECPDSADFRNQHSLTIELHSPPPRWLTNSTLHVSRLTEWSLPSNTSGDYHEGYFQFPVIDSSGYSSSFVVSSTDATVFTIDEMSWSSVFGSPGTTVLTIESQDGTAYDSVRLNLWETSELLLLTSSQLHTVNAVTGAPGAVVTWDAPSSGSVTPLDLLWDASRQRALMVSNKTVLPLPDMDGPDNGHIPPCSGAGNTIIDGALTAKGAGHSRDAIDIAVLVVDANTPANVTHCELNLDTYAEGLSFLLPNLECQYTMLISDPLSGEYTAFGTAIDGSGCTVRYHTRTGAYVELGSGVTGHPFGPLTLDEDPSDVGLQVTHKDYDPWNNRVPMQNNEHWEAFVWRLGEQQSPWALSPLWGESLSAIALLQDIPTGRFLGFGNWASTTSERIIHEYTPIISGANYVERVEPTSGRLTTSAVLDASHRRVYTADQGGEIWAFALDALSTTFGTDAGGTLLLGGILLTDIDDVVLHMAIAGPQPIELSTITAAAGDLVTVRGTGFAGNGDRVFVQGVEASVVVDTPNSITFRIPAEFADLVHELSPASVTVVSGGRMSGRVYGTYYGNGTRHLTLTPPRVGYSVGTVASYNSPCTSSPGCNGYQALVQGPDPDYAYSVTGAGLYMQSDFYSTFPAPPVQENSEALPQNAVTMSAGKRLVGTQAGEWVEMDLPFSFNSYEQPSTFGDTGSDDGILAVDAGQEILAIASGNQVTFRAASTLGPHALGTTSNVLAGGGPITAIAFLADRSALVAAGDNLTLSAISTRTGTATAVTAGTTDGCPTSGGATLVLSPHGEQGEGTWVTWHNGEAAVWSIVQEGGTVVRNCLGRIVSSHVGSTRPAAAVSPTGTLVAIAENAGDAVRTLRAFSRSRPHIEELRTPIDSTPFDMIFNSTGHWIHMADDTTQNSVSISPYPAQLSSF